MKTNHQLLSEILQRPDAKEVLGNALCNMLDDTAFGGVLDDEDLTTFLENAIPASDRLWCADRGPNPNRYNSMKTDSDPKSSETPASQRSAPPAGSPSWKVEDWCWCEHKLQQVRSVAEDGRVTEVSDGYFSHGSHDLRDRMYPLDLRGKKVSDEYDRTYSKLHADCKAPGLNFPDIHRWFVAEWSRAMESRDNDEAIKAAFQRLRDFVDGVMEKLRANREQAVEGVRLYR